MTQMLEMTSRRVADGGRQRTGSRGEGKQYNSTAEIIRMPSGTIVSVPSFELSNPLQTGLDIGVAMFWISYFLLWFFGLGFACWALLRAIHLL